MRDQRFIAKHRGGPLTIEQHRLLARWAADCAELVIEYFTQISDDRRPLQAIEVGRQWAEGEVTTGACMKASVAAHAAARATKDPAAVAAARAAGHAVATAHFAEHAFGPVIYGQNAAIAAGDSPDKIKARMIRKIPIKMKKLVLSALENPRFVVKAPASKARSASRFG